MDVEALKVQPPFFSPVGFRVSPFFIVGVKIIFQKEPPFF